jgi:ribosomal protein S18 acetylase RimI-like enzyme
VSGSVCQRAPRQCLCASTDQGIDVHDTSITIRPAQPADIPDLIRMKIALAAGDDALDTVRATPVDWMQDLFGDTPRFLAFVAERDGAAVGMAICCERYVTGWPGATIFLQDLFVDAAHRLRGVGAALVARVAGYAEECGSPIVELNVRANNPARRFYRKRGFEEVSNCAVFVAGVQVLRKHRSPGSDQA